MYSHLVGEEGRPDGRADVFTEHITHIADHYAGFTHSCNSNRNINFILVMYFIGIKLMQLYVR